ncbi:HNH endonuclease [Tessaracoccus rhinocerotis]|uniref:HNH endonuclease n=1 Tax=Tessaracoccus rhinocerotis TaxID=1689449 RepID=A0A553K520_9ACTN|nr:HNH endonuclease [Tessaracoccus rhinocerotis]TRY19742.1 HNH endonuclease [Tessaracoccus rhinocerotis]
MVETRGSGGRADEEPLADLARSFRMPQAVQIAGRTSSITNSFINSIIPVVPPTPAELRQALTILHMLDDVRCAYCGDTWTEWDHLRPLVVNKEPTGYISEIHNLVPACGKCNQSKGNRHWREWMFGPAALSPKTRGVQFLEAKAERLEAYESWKPPTRLDFPQLVGRELWNSHWTNYRRIIELMHEAQLVATDIRSTIRENYLRNSH